MLCHVIVEDYDISVASVWITMFFHCCVHYLGVAIEMMHFFDLGLNFDGNKLVLEA